MPPQWFPPPPFRSSTGAGVHRVERTGYYTAAVLPPGSYQIIAFVAPPRMRPQNGCWQVEVLMIANMLMAGGAAAAAAQERPVRVGVVGEVTAAHPC